MTSLRNRIAALTLPILLLGLLGLPSTALAAGELDESFDGDGKVTTDFGGYEYAHDVAVQADGKIVAAGHSESLGDFTLARYNPDGSLDPSFDGDGRVTTDFGSFARANALAIQSDGKIVAAGSTSGDFALARYNTDGSLDLTFGVGGKVVTDFGYNGTAPASGVALQADGKIVAVGSFEVGAGPSEFALARYNPDGSLDPTFAGDGILRTDIGTYDGATDVAIQSNGRIVAAGWSDGDFAAVRYLPSGARDASFDGDGRVVTDFGTAGDGASSVAIQTDGRIVAAGGTDVSGAKPDFALARWNSNGSLDSSFGGDGRVVTDFGAEDYAYSMAIQADGKIVAAGATGTYNPENDFALARYKPDGSLDPDFDLDGKVVTDFNLYDQANGIAIQPDGKIVAAGWTDSRGAGGYNFALARYVITNLPRITITDVKKFEGNAGMTRFVFTIWREAAGDTSTVSYRTADGTATAPSDYTAVGPGTVTFTAGETFKNVSVFVKGELAIEKAETFFMNLSGATNASIADGQGKAFIANDDLSPGASCTITGTNGNDVLNGTAGNDVICGGAGDDQIYGFDGSDVLRGEDGNDLLVGGRGPDLFLGGTGADDLQGPGDNDGNDTLRGGDQNDTLTGGAMSDALFGDAGADSLNTQDGVSGNDSADGGADSDSCVFDSGDFVTSCP